MPAIRRLLALTAAAALLAGCGSSGGSGACQKACETVAGCAAPASDDTASYCSLACVTSDGEADESGCTAEYDALNRCFIDHGAEACMETPPCVMESNAYGDCYSAWCASHPSQCPSG